MVQSRYDILMSTFPRPRTLPPARERTLLATAAREFAGAGFEGASLNTVIRACGMSKSSFYHFFDSKQALFDRVIEMASAALAKDLDVPDPACLAGPDFWPRLDAFVNRAMTVLARPSWYGDLGKMFYLRDLPAAHNPTMHRVLKGVNDWVQDVLSAGRACGAVRDDLPASLQAEISFALLLAMDRWSVMHMDRMKLAQRRRIVAQQLALLRRLLAP